MSSSYHYYFISDVLMLFGNLFIILGLNATLDFLFIACSLLVHFSVFVNVGALIFVYVIYECSVLTFVPLYLISVRSIRAFWAVNVFIRV